MKKHEVQNGGEYQTKNGRVRVTGNAGREKVFATYLDGQDAGYTDYLRYTQLHEIEEYDLTDEHIDSHAVIEVAGDELSVTQEMYRLACDPATYREPQTETRTWTWADYAAASVAALAYSGLHYLIASLG